MPKKAPRKPTPSKNQPFLQTQRGKLAGLVAVIGLALLLVAFTRYESYTSLYDAEYVGADKCGECHTVTYETWQASGHAKMVREPSPDTLLADFTDGSWTPPVEARTSPDDDQPVARFYTEGEDYYVALRDPNTNEFVPFKVVYILGSHYRQEFLIQEPGGVIRRFPLQWSIPQGYYFPYWNIQENSLPTLTDLWAQMTVLNSAWNLFCARCHTTHLVINDKDDAHTRADAEWTDLGIACEACHGPGSHHVNYFEHNKVNRVVAFVNSKLRGEPVAYIANAPKLTRGQDLSVCGRCHGSDIWLGTQDIYRLYEPGYSREGRVNDISAFFQETPLTPGRDAATVEVWADGTPKGIGMLFRSFIESDHYLDSDMACYDCHDPHNNFLPASEGMLAPSPQSNAYCLTCHEDLKGKEAEHSQHAPDTEGYYCYDCHAPYRLKNLAIGVETHARSHDMSASPDPAASLTFGLENSPNACNDCHADQTVEWAIEWTNTWWGE